MDVSSMKVGDLVFDSSIGQRGIIVESKLWENNVFGGPEVLEYVVLYEDGELDAAYDNELEVAA